MLLFTLCQNDELPVQEEMRTISIKTGMLAWIMNETYSLSLERNFL